MSHEPVEPEKTLTGRKPLWRRIVRWTLRVIVAVLVVAGVAWGIFNYISAKALRDEIGKIQAGGEPLTFRELDESRPAVKETEDAAPYYKAAVDLRRRGTDEKVSKLLNKLFEPTEGERGEVSGQVGAEIEDVLGDYALVLDLIDRGAERPQCAYDFGVSNGIAVVLPQFGDLRALARLLCLRTLWLAHQGRAEAAADSLISSLRMLRVFDRQPILIACLVKVACTRLHLGSVPGVLEAGPLSDQQLAKLELALGSADASRDMRMMFVAERVYLLEVSRNLIRGQRGLELGDAPSLPESAQFSSVRARPILRMMTVGQLRMYEQYISAARKGWPEALTAMKAVREPWCGILGAFVRISRPTLDRTAVLFGRTIGEVRAAEVAVVVERYRVANGRLPKSLDELRDFAGRDLPSDPFTGKGLVYRPQGEGFMVYSVGDDGLDDGGPLQEPEKDWGIVVRLPRISTSSSQPD
jgi:hypothetical protein